MSPILRNIEDWEPWLLVIKTMASPGNCPPVWDYINPDSATQPIEPVHPTRPAISEVKAEATSYANLNALEQRTYDFMYKMYMMKPRPYRPNSQ